MSMLSCVVCECMQYTRVYVILCTVARSRLRVIPTRYANEAIVIGKYESGHRLVDKGYFMKCMETLEVSSTMNNDI